MKYPLIFRILLAATSLLVISTLFLPLWEIYLWAPQYPEGLSITIWHNDVKGDVDVINGLNHYIGMKHIKAEMFPEFKFLKIIIICFVIFGVFTAWMGTVKWLRIFCIATLLGGVIALADFYRWGYDYGHNLDPTAPIQVPGMAYQPPVLGYKDLLNFTALSTPAAGGWIIVSVGAIAFIAWFYMIWQKRKNKSLPLTTILLFTLMFTLGSCKKSNPEINFGETDCSFCQMKLSDNKFGLLLQTPKGREYIFDDYHCYNQYLQEHPTDIAAVWVVPFDKPGTLISVNDAMFVHADNVKSPMGSNIAFFSNEKELMNSFPGNTEHGTFQALTHE